VKYFLFTYLLEKTNVFGPVIARNKVDIKRSRIVTQLNMNEKFIDKDKKHDSLQNSHFTSFKISKTTVDNIVRSKGCLITNVIDYHNKLQ
jgi:hypothetical protein